METPSINGTDGSRKARYTPDPLHHITRRRRRRRRRQGPPLGSGRVVDSGVAPPVTGRRRSPVVAVIWPCIFHLCSNGDRRMILSFAFRRAGPIRRRRRGHKTKWPAMRVDTDDRGAAKWALLRRRPGLRRRPAPGSDARNERRLSA